MYGQEFKTDLEELNSMLEGEELDTTAFEEKVKIILGKVRDVAEDNQKMMADTTAPFKEGVAKEDLKETNDAIEEYRKKLSFAQNTQAWINIASQVGTLTSSIMALTNVTKIWEDTTISAGEKILSIIGALGYSIPMLTSSLSSLNKSLPKVLSTIAGKDAPWLKDKEGNAFSTLTSIIGALPGKTKLVAAAVVASIAVIGVAIWAIVQKINKAQDQINNLNEASTSLKTQYQELQTEISNVKSAFDEYDSIILTLNGCARGTAEWEENLRKANTTALELLSTYPELAKLENAFIRVDGTLRVNRETIDEYIASLEEQAAIIQAAGTMGSSLAKNKQAKLDKKDLLEDIQISAYSDQVNNHNQMNSDRQSRAQETRKIIEDNFESLANLTQEEYKVKLVELGVEGVFIDSLLDYQTKIDDMAEQADNAATELEMVADQIANIIIGDGGDDKESVATQNILASSDYENEYESQYDKLLSKYTGSGISKASGGNNEIYQEMLKELQKVEGYKDFNKARNGVQGTDNNRIFEFTVNGETKTMSAEEVASIIAANKAKSSVENTDYATQAKKILEPLEKALGGDKALADLLISAIESGDYSGLSAEQIEKIKNAQKDGLLTNIISSKDQETLGINFSEGVTAAIENWDPKAAEKALKNKLNQMYEGAAKNLDVDEDMIRIFVDGLKENSKQYKVAEEELIELAIAAIKFQKTLKTLGDGLENNKDLLNEWAKSEKSAADLGIDTAAAVGDLKKGLSDLLGLDVDEDFLKENFDLIQKAIKGDVDALDDLEAAAGKDFIVNLDVEGIDAIYDEYNTMFEQLANTDLEIGAKFNDEEALAKLQQFFATAKLSQEDAQAVLNKYGYKGELEKIDVPAVKGTKKVPRTTITGWNTFTAPSTTFYTPDTNGRGYTSTTVPGNTYKEPVYGITYDEEEYEVTPASSYYVLKSADGSSTNTDIKTTGLTNSVTSLGTGKARASAVSTGVGRGSSKGSSAKPKVEKHREDEKDIYHDVNVSLAQISNNLEKVQAQTDQLVGQSRIDNLAQQFGLLNKQIDKTNEKIDIAKGEMKDLQSELSGSGIQFNTDGTIANYAAAYDAQLASLNRVIDHYNSLSADGQEGYQDILDKANENFDKFLKNISRYDEILTNEIPEMESDIYDTILSQIELKLDAFHQEITIRLDMAEAERDWNSFFNKVIKDIEEEDIVGNTEARLKDFLSYYKDDMKGVIQVNTQHINDILSDLKAMDEGLDGKFYSKDGVDNRAQALEDLKTYYEQLMSDLESVHDLSDEIHESYVDMIDEAQEKFDEQISTFETINNLIEHDKNVISMIYGEEAYSALSQFYDRQEENYNKQLDFQKQQVEFWQMQMAAAEEGSDAWNAAKENWLSAVDAWNSAIETAIENLQDKYLNAINAIFQNLNNNVTNGMGLDFVETE